MAYLFGTLHCLGACHDCSLGDLVQFALEVEDARARPKAGGLGLADFLGAYVGLHPNVSNLLFNAILHLETCRENSFDIFVINTLTLIFHARALEVFLVGLIPSDIEHMEWSYIIRKPKIYQFV